LVSVLLAFAIVSTSRAASDDWLWTKKQAEYYVGGNVGLGTLCVPKGAAYRKGGLNYYSLFGCLVALKNGAQYALTIKPTGAKTYKRLTVHQIRAANSG
jgi:hypothetical protein